MLGLSDVSCERLADEREALMRAAREQLKEAPARMRVRHELRYRGQSYELAVDGDETGGEPQELVEAFAGEHARRYGYRDDDAAIELVNIRVSVWGTAPPLRPTGAAGARPRCGEAEVIFDGGAARATVLRGELHSGTRVAGPALCALPHASLLVPPGWSGEVDRHGTCCLERIK